MFSSLLFSLFNINLFVDLGCKSTHFFSITQTFRYFFHFSLFTFHFFFVPLATPKALSFEKTKEKIDFILLFAHLFVPLHPNSNIHTYFIKKND